MLTERAATVLNVLVGEYLQTATPVASGEIAQSLDQKLSSASVRDTMARLIEEGYIFRPHVSSGGVSSTVCVIGPKRIEYVAAIGGVRHLSAFLSQMVLGIQGNSAE